MSEVLVKIIDKLPVDVVTMLVIGVFAAALFILPKVRRDKNGKLYIFSMKYERNQQRHKKTMDILQSIKLELLETMAWTQRIVLFSESFPVGERIAAGSRLEQLSDGWKKTDCCYNGEAKVVHSKLSKLINDMKVNSNDYIKDRTKSIKEIGG